MELSGLNFIGNELSGEGKEIIHAVNPSNNSKLLPGFHEATNKEIENAIVKAGSAFVEYGKKSGKEKALFLETIANQILELGDDLIQRCGDETGLPAARLIGERGRTVNQLKMFAELLREGSWIDARIETANPDRQPVPKPDIRSMQRALGPVGIFGASNFPLAFSVAGGDTASALAAGCTVVVKAHPAHPGTCELIAKAVRESIKNTGMPDGAFSMVHGRSNEVGMAIVKHPLIKAIGFTGSFSGGKAIFDEAARRPEPIPVYAEMGSTNPVFILPGALRERKEEIARDLTVSVTLGVGQFCTNPGLVFFEESEEAIGFQNDVIKNFSEILPGTMLTENIFKSYVKDLEVAVKQYGITRLSKGKIGEGLQGTACLLNTKAKKFLANKKLEEEIFGPSTLTVTAEDKSELINIALNLRGHLTATIHATEKDLKNYEELIAILERKVGRLIINGYPTGVEVCHSMVHGGPYPATTDSRSTSVGTLAITRFTRPICYQNFPDELLSDELKNDNPLRIWRLVNGERKNN
ncbi:MAG: 2,5-dioxovalerate dehydrogenase [Ignavibacteria bacterium RBG_13_36_8]|nr:MAG: 2,5-dioxovalerate dehydrogenase [Ignavibacteria bacterium RBG_13_36_8]